MNDPSKKKIIKKIEAFWWLPFLVLTIGGIFYNLFSGVQFTNTFAYVMLACSFLAFIGWLTRKKIDNRAGDNGGESNTQEIDKEVKRDKS